MTFLVEGWHSVRTDPPPEGLEVIVMNNDGAHLVRKGNLWFLPDMSMYVYYTPEYWRPITDAPKGIR